MELTGRVEEAMGRCMKTLILFLVAMGTVWAQDTVVEQAPPQVVASATKAVADLGKEVVMGRYAAAIERMYPQWKERTAKRMGGMEKMQQQLDGVAKRMLQQGISVTDFKPQGVPRPFEVGPGKVVVTENGRSIEKLRYTKWMVLVPTVTKFRTLVEGVSTPVVIESTGFQVAIADKGKENWSFIDGSSVSVADLRSLFVNLPQDLELPPLEKRQVR